MEHQTFAEKLNEVNAKNGFTEEQMAFSLALNTLVRDTLGKLDDNPDTTTITLEFVLDQLTDTTEAMLRTVLRAEGIIHA